MKPITKESKMNGLNKHIVRLGLVVLAILMLWIPGTTLAAGQSRNRAYEEGAVQVELPKVRVSIASKTARSVTTSIGDTYTVSKQTIIVGTDGHQVSIRKMMVPCEAEVTYSIGRDGQKPLAEMIRIKSVGNNPTLNYSGGNSE